MNYCVYCYRAWLRIDELGLSSVYKIGYTKDLKIRIPSLISWAKGIFDAVDDSPYLVVDNLTKNEALGMENDIHEYLNYGSSKFSPHEKNLTYSGNTGFRLSGTKEWFSITDFFANFIVEVFGMKYSKEVKRFNPKATIIDGAQCFHEEQVWSEEVQTKTYAGKKEYVSLLTSPVETWRLYDILRLNANESC